MKTEIIYEDKDVLVIRKPAGLATQTAKVGQPDVASELKNYLSESAALKGQPYLGIVHRLDQPVEGLLVFGKNKKAAAALTEQLGGKGDACLLNKRYYAVFCGKPLEKEGELVDYMYKDNTGRAVIVEKPGKGQAAQRASLWYQVMQSVQLPSGEEIFLADIVIHTGRFHQIRAQMAHAGMALLGDVKYGDELSRACSRSLGVQTVALCAYSLEFTHPAAEKSMSFQTKPRTRAFSFFEP